MNVVATLFLMTPSLHAQTESGTLSGTVTDPAGANISKVTVAIKNAETGQTRAGETNSTGFFSFPVLPPGQYVVNVSASGFQKATSSVALSAGQVLNVNFQLKIGSAGETVDVIAAAPVGIETSTHDLSNVREGLAMENSPQYTGSRGETFGAQVLEVGVQPLELPGDQPFGNTLSGYNTWSNALYIGGQGVGSTTYLQDGVVDMNYFTQSATVQPPVEATQEVQVVRNNPNARYDGASVVNVVSKGGTETFHGRLYEQLQNNAMDARVYRSGPLAQSQYNQYGGNAGWVVPFTRKKLFFFVDYQGYRLHNYAFLQEILPTQAERNGDFSADLAANTETGQPGSVIYDPNTYAGAGASGPSVLQQFSYNGQANVIDPARISAFAKQYLNTVYPLPNFKNTSAGENYGSTSSRTIFEHDDYLFRGDYNISDKDHLYGAYNTGDPAIIRPEFVDNCACAQHNKLYGTDIYVEESHVFTPTFVNTARLGYSRAITGKFYDNVGDGTNYFNAFGLTGLSPDPSVWSWPNANPGGFSGPSGSTTGSTEDSYQVSDEINWVHGKHSVFFGVEVDKRFYKGVWMTGSPNGALATSGEYTYNGSTTDFSGAPLAAWQNPNQGWILGSGTVPLANRLADFLLGYYSSTGASAGTQIGWFNQWNFMPYIQDDWRITSRLTLNLGLRYDNYGPPKEKNNNAGIYDIVSNTYKQESYPANNLNFSPRVGFAYTVDDKTSLRGGFGVFYYQYGYVNLVDMMNNPNTITSLNSTQTQNQPVVWPSSNAAGNPDIPGSAPGQQEFFTLQNAEAVWAAMPKPVGVFAPGSSATTFAPHMPTSYVESYNLSLQRTLWKRWLATVDYVGSQNRHGYFYSNVNLARLPDPGDVNAGSTPDINSRRPYQTFQGNLMQSSKWGSSNYNALEAQISKSFSNGFELISSIVWQKSLDDQSDDNNRAGMAGLNPSVDYGVSDFNQRYVYKANGIYELPIGRGKALLNGGRWWENQLGGWRLSLAFTVNAGMPVSVIAADNSLTGGGIDARATQTCNANIVSNRSFDNFFNKNCYSAPAAGTFGNERRNDIVGPRNTNVDASIMKEFALYDRLRFQWRTDAFSALNHPLAQAPDATLTDANFGKITSWAGSRVIQMSAKIIW